MKCRYWVDANVFIWGSREPYPLPGAQAYWNWFESKVDAGKIISHWKSADEVLEGEKKGKEDPIVNWVKSRKDKLKAPQDTKELQKLTGEICKYCYDTFGPEKTPEFTRGADLWLIASAKIDSGVVVTQECKRKQIRIPAVCRAFDVDYIDLFKMNRVLKMSL